MFKHNLYESSSALSIYIYIYNTISLLRWMVFFIFIYKMFTSNLNYIKVMKEKLNAKELQMISDQDNVQKIINFSACAWLAHHIYIYLYSVHCVVYIKTWSWILYVGRGALIIFSLAVYIYARSFVYYISSLKYVKQNMRFFNAIYLFSLWYFDEIWLYVYPAILRATTTYSLKRATDIYLRIQHQGILPLKCKA